MELIYIYIESFRNIKNLDLTLSDKFKVTYDNTSNTNSKSAYRQNPFSAGNAFYSFFRQ